MRTYKCIVLLLVALLLTSPMLAQDLPREVPPPSDNAAVWYLTAALMINDWDDELSEIAQDSSEAFDLAQAGPVIDRLDGVLYYVREGTKRDACSWAVDLSLGPMVLLPQLGELRKLSRTLAVSALVRLERGDPAGAIDDWLAVMRMAPHAAADGTIIANLVHVSIKNIAITPLSSRLDTIDREHLSRLQQGLDTLDDQQPVWKAVAVDRVIVAWFRRQYQAEGIQSIRGCGLWSNGQMPPEIEALVGSDRADQTIADWLDEMDQFYDRAIEVAKLPPADFTTQATKLDQEISESANPLVRELMPGIVVARNVELRAQSIRTMLDAMIAYRLGGEQAFESVVDPYDAQPFDFEVTDDGVVLRSRYIHRDGERVSLTFPAACAQPLD